jgi:hypothetical protein
VGPDIETLLPVTQIYMEDYHNKVAHGQLLLKTTNITVISLVRNIGKILETNIENISSFFRSHCKTYRHIFFENDSADNTKDVIQQFQSKYPDNIYIISENLNREHFGSVKSEDRLKALAEYRNKAKSYASEFESDFIIILDMDFDSISLYGILNSFGWMASFDSISAVAGNSFQYKKGLYTEDPERYNLWNYDSWAYRHTWWTDLQVVLPAPENTYDSMLWFGLWIPPVGCSPMVVNSAFGGCGIYRSSIYFLADYDDKDCEHVCFHYNLLKKNPLFKLALNPSQRMLFLA